MNADRSFSVLLMIGFLLVGLAIGVPAGATMGVLLAAPLEYCQ